MALNCPFAEYTSGAGALSKNTRVPPSILLRWPFSSSAAPTRLGGQKPVPKIVMISPGATRPESMLAAFTNPALVKKGPLPTTFSVTADEVTPFGFDTVTASVPGFASSVCGTNTRNVFASTNVVFTALPLSNTREPLTNPLPVTVTSVSDEPNCTVGGFTAEITGVDATVSVTGTLI